MGKVKLSKNKRKKASSGIPNWLLLTIVLVVVAAVLLTCAAMLVSSMGVVMRCSMAMETDNYTVNGNMMTYYLINTYSNFLEQYGSTASMLSIGGNVALTELRHIKFGSNQYDQLVLPNFKGETWFDCFMNQTEDSVKTMLMYCEEANARGIKLDKEDKAAIKANIEASVLSFQMQYTSLLGSSDTTTITAMYGEGIRKTDIRKAMELSALAAKCQEAIYNEITALATDAEIDKVYNANKKTYDLVDYYTYTFSTSFEEVAKEVVSGYSSTTVLTEAQRNDIIKKFKEKIADIKHEAEHITEKTDLQSFKKAIYYQVISAQYDTVYAAQVKDSAIAPDTASKEIIKNKLIDAVATEAASDATAATDDAKDGKLYGIDVKTEFATAAKKIKDELFTKARAIDKTSLVNKANYDENDAAFGDWAFNADRKAGDRNTIVEGGTYAKDEDIKAADKFMAKVYFLIKPQYRDDELSRDVAYMLFEKEEAAKAAISKIEILGAGLNKDTFAKAATEANALGNTLVENCMKGNMASDTFDNWLFSADTKAGAYTKSPIKMTDGSFMVALFVADGDPCWKVTVKNHIVTENAKLREDALVVSHGAKVKRSQWTIDRIAVDDSHTHEEETTTATTAATTAATTK